MTAEDCRRKSVRPYAVSATGAFYSDIRAFYSDIRAFYSDTRAFYSDTGAFYSGTRAFYSDNWGAKYPLTIIAIIAIITIKAQARRLHNAGNGRKDIVRQLRFDFLFGAPPKNIRPHGLKIVRTYGPKGRRVQTGSHYLLYFTKFTVVLRSPL